MLVDIGPNLVDIGPTNVAEPSEVDPNSIGGGPTAANFGPEATKVFHFELLGAPTRVDDPQLVPDTVGIVLPRAGVRSLSTPREPFVGRRRPPRAGASRLVACRAAAPGSPQRVEQCGVARESGRLRPHRVVRGGPDGSRGRAGSARPHQQAPVAPTLIQSEPRLDPSRFLGDPLFGLRAPFSRFVGLSVVDAGRGAQGRRFKAAPTPAVSLPGALPEEDADEFLMDGILEETGAVFAGTAIFKDPRRAN